MTSDDHGQPPDGAGRGELGGQPPDRAGRGKLGGRPPDGAGWGKLGGQPGLCMDCEHARLNETRRGTAYLRCLRASWDDRLVRYPRLPVSECVGFEAR